MSFINSILADLGGGEKKSLPINNPSSALRHGPSESSSTASKAPTDLAKGVNVSSGQKRKAEEMTKARNNGQQVKNPAPLLPSTASRSSSETAAARSKPSVDINGVSSAGRSSPVVSASSASSPKPPPRKGTFAETLARAKAAQSASMNIGAIKHKPHLSKKEREALEAKSKTTVQSQKSERHGEGKITAGYKGTALAKPNVSVSKGTSLSTKQGAESRPIRPKPRQELSYKGTAQVKPSTTSVKDVHKTPDSPDVRKRRYRYDDYSDEQDESAQDSEGSSDMEAPAHELEEEEFASLRTARKEDEDALREEAALKRAKDEKRRKLMAGKR
ncbi:MAG: hypothetical protein M4579_002526 [Chaenotheca gracillima]|nr:MAG: hypothetical protein M4579_002526 [Chaenotheca gracillima]